MPVKILAKAGDLYLKSMNEYKKSGGGCTTASWGMGTSWGLPITGEPLGRSLTGNWMVGSLSRGNVKGLGGTRKVVSSKLVVDGNGINLSCSNGNGGYGCGLQQRGMVAVRRRGSIVFRMDMIEDGE
ncbi:hypothetical protein Dimus_004508 [Dionaea muscipula]